MRQFKRSDRLAEQIRRDLSELLDSELSERGYGMVTFTHVKLSRDLRNARVYYSFLGDENGREQVQEYFSRERRRIRSDIGRNLRVRHIPELSFEFDPSVEEGMRIEQLLNEIKRSEDQ